MINMLTYYVFDVNFCMALFMLMVLCLRFINCHNFHQPQESFNSKLVASRKFLFWALTHSGTIIKEPVDWRQSGLYSMFVVLWLNWVYFLLSEVWIFRFHGLKSYLSFLLAKINNTSVFVLVDNKKIFHLGDGKFFSSIQCVSLKP